jgi:hypothetical protein
MSKCPKCGCQCEDGAKFCDECGAPIPQEKECPKCHAHIGLNAKFCDECGFSFENVGTKQATIAMGDKNVIAGDVVAHKESYDIKGDATIVRNEDESKKMVQCSDCGKNIPVSRSFECRPVIGLYAKNVLTKMLANARSVVARSRVREKKPIAQPFLKLWPMERLMCRIVKD